MLANARHRAKARGRVFNLTIEDIVVPETCPVLGIPIAFGHANRDNRPSIDRLDNARGYEKGNVRIISHRANRIKTNASAAELYAVAAYAAGL